MVIALASTKEIINKLEAILSDLGNKAQLLDQQNKQKKSFYNRRDKALFSRSIFATDSDKLVPYVQESLKLLKQIERLYSLKQFELLDIQLKQIEQQTCALMSAINANESINRASQQQLETQKMVKFKKAAKKIMQPTQELHQQLAETFEFERRLQEMLNNKQQELSSTSLSKAKKVQQEVLVLHQRLGRCRQAISKIERQIEMQEKRY